MIKIDEISNFNGVVSRLIFNVNLENFNFLANFSTV